MNPSRRMLCNVINHFQLACLSFRKFLFDFLLLHQSSAKVLSNTYTPFLVDFPVSRHCDTITIQLDTEEKKFHEFFQYYIIYRENIFLSFIATLDTFDKVYFQKVQYSHVEWKVYLCIAFFNNQNQPPSNILFIPICT